MGWPEDKDIYQKRDAIFSEIHSDVKYLRERIDDQKVALADHIKKDETFQSWMIKIGVIVLIIVVANGGISAIKTIFHVG